MRPRILENFLCVRADVSYEKKKDNYNKFNGIWFYTQLVVSTIEAGQVIM